MGLAHTQREVETLVLHRAVKADRFRAQFARLTILSPLRQ
jgi:hypothetical protein